MTGAQHKVVGIGFGIAGSYAAVTLTGDTTGATMLLGAVIGCMLPDIDHDRTKIGRVRKGFTDLLHNAFNVVIYGGVALGCLIVLLSYLGFNKYGVDVTKIIIGVGGILAFALVRKVLSQSDTVKWATKHRGFMHTIIVPVLLYLLSISSAYPLWKYPILGCSLGYCSHLFADMLTVEGCPVLWPITKQNIRFLSLRTKDKSCTYAAYIVAILAPMIVFVALNGLGALPEFPAKIREFLF